MRYRRHTVVAATIAAAGLALAGCAPSEDEEPTASGTADASSCTAEGLQTMTEGALTVATGSPAYEPWVVDDDPSSGKGFEAAVAYAAAEKLGFATDDVTWVRTTFDSAVAPGPKTFDWNVQQFSITSQRKEAVDMSSPYYEASQAVITYDGSPIAGATTIAELTDAKLGAAVGSTSLDDAQEVIAPSQDVAVYNDNAAAVTALKNHQIDGIVIDTPTAFALVGDGTVENGVIVGQLPETASGETDSFGVVLPKDSSLTACTSWAIDQLRADGTLDDLQAQWLEASGAPVLK